MLGARHDGKVFDGRRSAPWFAALVTGALAVAACGGDDDTAARVADRREAQAREVAAEAGLPADVQSLLGQAARAPQATFSASFAAGTGTIIVHQAPPRRRVDVVDGGVARESFITDDDGRTVRCERPEGRGWTCGDTEGADDAPVAGGAVGGGVGAFSPELVARTVEALEEGLAAYDVRVEPLTVAGVRARCLRTVPKDGSGDATATSQLCISPDGVPVLVDRGDGSPVLRAMAYRTRVDAADLRRPDE